MKVKEIKRDVSVPDTVRKPSRVAVGLYFTNVGLAQLWVMKNLGEARVRLGSAHKGVMSS